MEDLVYCLKVFKDDTEIITIEAYDEDSLLEQLNKVDKAIYEAGEEEDGE